MEKENNKDQLVDLKKEEELVSEEADSNIIRSKNTSSRVAFSWIAKDFSPPPKGPFWYLAFIAIFVLLVVVSIIQKSWLFLAVIVLGTLSYILVSRRGPMYFEVKVSDEGVEVGRDFFTFSNLEGFGFYVKRGEDLFVLETNRLTQKLIVLPIKVNKDKLGDFLIKYIPEKEYEEGVLDMLEDLLKF